MSGKTVNKGRHRADGTVNKRVHRYDRFAIGSNVQVTPQGFLRIPASVTRTGILEYRRQDGTVWKELRLPAEVHREDSLATLRGAPITEDHHGMITPDNVRQHRVGHVAETVTHTDRLVDADLIVEDRNTINRINNKELVEISAGYSSDVEFNAGIWNGQRYDAIQRGIVYNHIALGPKDWARGGGELTLHLDSKDEKENTAVAVHLDKKDGQETGTPVENTNPKQRGIGMKKIQVRLDGVPYEIEIPEALETTFSAAVEKLKKEKAESSARLDSIQGKLDAARQENKELQGKLEVATDPKAIEKAVKERVQLVQDCQKLHPEIETDGKADKALKLEALEKVGLGAERFDGKSDGYIDGFFNSKVEAAPTKTDSVPSVGVAPVIKTERQDGAIDPHDSEAARQRMIKRGQEAYLGKTNSAAGA